MTDFKNPYAYLVTGFGFVFLDMSLFGLPDILADFLGYLSFAIGIHLLPSSHNLKRWSKKFALMLMVLSIVVELDQWLAYKVFGEIGIQLMQFLFIAFMYYVFQLLLHIHHNLPLEMKTFKTYQRFMILMLSAFVIQAFAMNIDRSIGEHLHLIALFLQLLSYLLFTWYYRACHKYYKEINTNKAHTLE